MCIEFSFLGLCRIFFTYVFRVFFSSFYRLSVLVIFFVEGGLRYREVATYVGVSVIRRALWWEMYCLRN